MKRLLLIGAIFSLGLVLASCQPKVVSRTVPALQLQPLTLPKIQRPPVDYGVTYDSFYYPFDIAESKIRADLARAKDAGATSIYITINEDDIENSQKMTRILRIGHQLGLRVYVDPYIGGTFSGDEGRSAARYLEKHPDEAQVSSKGTRSGLPCINYRGFRDYMKEKVRGILKYNFDGIFFDEPAFNITTDPSDYYCRDAACREMFTRRYGHPMPYTLTQEVLEFKQATMAEFLQELIITAKETRPNAVTILDVLPRWDEFDYYGTVNWKLLASSKGLDVFQTDPYWFPTNAWDGYVANIDKLLEATAGTNALPGIWVQGFAMTGGYERISQSLTYAEARGISWLSVWLTENQPNADMEVTWSQIKQVYEAPP